MSDLRSKRRRTGQAGRPDRARPSCVPARPCTTANTGGRIASVANVAAARPPTTARPSGAASSAPAPIASAIGSMPAIMARLVIRIGRSATGCPVTAAASAGCPPVRRLSSANVTSRIALATATPMAMIAPMNDCRLSVVPVSEQRDDDSAQHRRHGGEHDERRACSDWKFADKQQKDHEDRGSESNREVAQRLAASARSGRARSTVYALRRIARALRAPRRSPPTARPRSSPETFAPIVIIRWPL